MHTKCCKKGKNILASAHLCGLRSDSKFQCVKWVAVSPLLDLQLPFPHSSTCSLLHVALVTLYCGVRWTKREGRRRKDGREKRTNESCPAWWWRFPKNALRREKIRTHHSFSSSAFSCLHCSLLNFSYQSIFLFTSQSLPLLNFFLNTTLPFDVLPAHKPLSFQNSCLFSRLSTRLTETCLCFPSPTAVCQCSQKRILIFAFFYLFCS